jgi:hypothetical protein
MIEIQNIYPENKEHFFRLLEFYEVINGICQELTIEPVLNGSLAVFGYTRNQVMKVNDIDLACSEMEFPRICRALDAKCIDYVVKDWHVLQVRQEDLKVEFDSIEYWMKDLPIDYEYLLIRNYPFKIVLLPVLKQLYQRGLEGTACFDDKINRAKYANFIAKLELLNSVTL